MRFQVDIICKEQRTKHECDLLSGQWKSTKNEPIYKKYLISKRDKGPTEKKSMT